MTLNHTIPWEWLEKQSAAAFLIAGGLKLLHVAQSLLLELSTFSIPELARDLSLAIALFFAVIGLLGFIPRFRDAMPRLARSASIIAVLALIGLLAVAIGEPLAEYLQGGEPEQPVWFIPLFLLYFVGVPLSFLIFGSASVRSHSPSRIIGWILLLIFISFLFFFHIIPLFSTRLLTQIPASVIALGFLTVGYLLLADTALQSRHVEASTPGRG